jgi:hypothetical protein
MKDITEDKVSFSQKAQNGKKKGVESLGPADRQTDRPGLVNGRRTFSLEDRERHP